MALWCAFHLEQRRPVHLALLVFTATFAAIHWAEYVQARRHLASPVLNSIPFVAFAAITPSRRGTWTVRRLLSLLAMLSFFACKRPLASGDSFQDCAECPTMIVVPAGRFLMGSLRRNRGVSRTKVRSTRSASRTRSPVSRDPVTRSEYERFVRATKRPDPDGMRQHERRGEVGRHRGAELDEPRFEQSGDHPAVCVSWGRRQRLRSMVERA
jgi:formylglycine-generating enzyme required for sulfatase activity